METIEEIKKELDKALLDTSFNVDSTGFYNEIETHCSRLQINNEYFNTKLYRKPTDKLILKHCNWLGDCLGHEQNLHILINMDIKSKELPNSIKSFYYVLLVIADKHGKKLKNDCTQYYSIKSTHIKKNHVFEELLQWHIDFFSLLINNFKKYLPDRFDVIEVMSFCNNIKSSDYYKKAKNTTIKSTHQYEQLL